MRNENAASPEHTVPGDASTLDLHILEREAKRLEHRYRGTFAPIMIEWFVFESYAAQARGAQVRDYMAATAGREANERLRAIQQSLEGTSVAHPVVLFVCADNIGRARLAASFLKDAAGDAVAVRSAGSLSGDNLHPETRSLLVEGLEPEPLTEAAVRSADVVITLDCAHACPVYPDKEYADWELPAARESEVTEAERVADALQDRVAGLWEHLASR